MGSTRQSHRVGTPRSAPLSSTGRGERPKKDNRVRPQVLRRHIQRFPQASVLIVGDLILDHYVWGHVSRISPEAPVPVVQVHSESLQLGGAANVYSNVLALGGRADVCGVVGADEGGRRLLHKLGIRRQGRGGVIIDPDRPTTRKTRVIAHNQQVVRFDVERRTDIKTRTQKRIIRYVESRLREVSCLVVSDYVKGVVTAPLMSELTSLAARRRVPVLVDPKVEHLSYYKGVTLITPNHQEAAQAAGVYGDDDRSLEEVGEVLRQRLGCQCVLVTRGEKGMSVFGAEGARWHIPTTARQVYDVTGAGDTVVGTLALAVATGASFHDAAVLANYAAGIVVGMVGTSTVSAQQLTEAVGYAS